MKLKITRQRANDLIPTFDSVVRSKFAGKPEAYYVAWSKRLQVHSFQEVTRFAAEMTPDQRVDSEVQKAAPTRDEIETVTARDVLWSVMVEAAGRSFCVAQPGKPPSEIVDFYFEQAIAARKALEEFAALSPQERDRERKKAMDEMFPSDTGFGKSCYLRMGS